MNKMSDFVKKEWLRMEKSVFMSKILLIVIGYVGITLWLNSIRATASISFVWILIIIQLSLYFSIFSTSYQRFSDCGHKRLGIIPFAILSVLGRVNDWELAIIPLLVIIMLIISAKTNHIPHNNETL